MINLPTELVSISTQSKIGKAIQNIENRAFFGVVTVTEDHWK